MQQMRLRPLRRLPIAFGWLTKRGDAATAALDQAGPEPARDPPRHGPDAAGDRGRAGLCSRPPSALRRFDRPALVVWAGEDRVMPPEHGRRLADLLPHGRLVEIADSYTLVPLDQPDRLAAVIRSFVGDADGG